MNKLLKVVFAVVFVFTMFVGIVAYVHKTKTPEGKLFDSVVSTSQQIPFTTIDNVVRKPGVTYYSINKESGKKTIYINTVMCGVIGIGQVYADSSDSLMVISPGCHRNIFDEPTYDELKSIVDNGI